MSKGPGRIERAIEAAFAAEPNNAFTVEDLCDRVYRGESIEKKHRVAVLRAAKKIAKQRGDIGTMAGEGLGGMIVFFGRYRVLSYAMARLKVSNLNRYRSNDKRDIWTLPRSIAKHTRHGDPGKGMVWRVKRRGLDEEQLRASLSEEGSNHKLVVPGGAWWRHVQQHIAERDGDTEKFEALKAEGEKELNGLLDGSCGCKVPEGEEQCNFCGKLAKDVEHMLGGTRAYICNECVDLGVKVIQEQRAKKDELNATDLNVSERNNASGLETSAS